jgi:hypothetical protein
MGPSKRARRTSFIPTMIAKIYGANSKDEEAL